MFNRICGFYFYLFVLIVCTSSQICHADGKGSGVAALESGIENYERGNYDDAILKLEIALIQIPEESSEDQWKAQFYLGLSYYHTGEYKEAGEKFKRIVKLYDDVIALNESVVPDRNRSENVKSSVRVKDGLLVRAGVALKVITKKETKIHNEPDSNSQVIENVGLFKTLFVFSADLESNKQDTTTNGFYRVGLTPDEEKIMGWVNGKDVQEWANREVAKFAPLAGRGLEKIYKTKEDLVAVIQSGDPDVRKAVAEELSSTSFKTYKTLLPILNISDENIADHNRGLYQIAFLDSPDTVADEISGEKQIPDPEDSDSLLKNGQLDIMFVIDTTRSMMPYVDKLREIAKPLSELIKNQPDISAQFGIVAYRDRIFEKPQQMMGYVYKLFTPLTDDLETFQEVLNTVTTEDVGTDSEGTPEAVFDGLNEAINGDVGWRYHGVKVIVLIGDASAEEFKYKNPHNYTLDGLLTDASAKAIRIYAIKLDGGDEADSEKHEKQWKWLSDGASPGTKGAYIRVANGPQSVEEYMKKLKSSIINEFDLTRKLKEIASTYSKTGVVTQAPDIVDDEFMVLKSLVDIPSGKEVKNQKLTFSTGWVQLEQNGIPVIEPHIMMSDGELEALNYILDGLQIIIKKGNKPVRTGCFPSSGSNEESKKEDIGEDENISDFIKRWLGIPVQTKLLRFTLAEIKEWNKAQQKRKIDALEEKSKFIKVFYGDENNWHVVADDYSYAYVPLSLLP
jgi:serine/threonine-protein kinase PpkA